MDRKDLEQYERFWRANRSIAERAGEEGAAPLAKDRDWLANRRFLRAVDKAIASVQDPLEREVLRLRYTDFRLGRRMTWPEVTAQLYPGRRPDRKTMYRLHASALRHLERCDSNAKPDPPRR
ncbi:hypothetical protein [uncultured Ruthenibacterium sp.]|uniref:hypothetical protein n=1 Tax=uncultured Ruthenibacterium sp. TaxID=1905347 RepID=UPI00349E7713